MKNPNQKPTLTPKSAFNAAKKCALAARTNMVADDKSGYARGYRTACRDIANAIQQECEAAST